NSNKFRIYKNIAHALINLGVTNLDQDDLITAEKQFIQAEQYIDKMKNIAATETNSTAKEEYYLQYKSSKASVLGKLGRVEFLLANYQAALKLYQRQLQIVETIKDPLRRKISRVSLLNNFASIDYRHGKYNQSLKGFQQQLQIAEELNNRAIKIYALDGLGMIYKEMGQYEQARIYLEEQKKIAQQIKSCQGEIRALNKLGLLELNKLELELAETQLQTALKLAQEKKIRRSQVHILGNLGSTYLEMGVKAKIDKNNQEARINYQKAIEKYTGKLTLVQENKDYRSEGAVLSNLGSVYTKLYELEKIEPSQIQEDYFLKAEESLLKAIKIFEKIGDENSLSAAKRNLGYLYEIKGNTIQAIEEYKESIDIRENLRTNITMSAAKSSYFDQQVNSYQRLVNLLWKQAEKAENETERNNYEKQIFNYVQRAKARTFVEQLSCTEIKLLPEDVSQKQELEIKRDKWCQVKEELNHYQIVLRESKNRPQSEQNQTEIQNYQTKVESLEIEYDQLLTQLKSQVPEFSNLINPQPISLQELRSFKNEHGQKYLNEDTTIVEYFITKKRSFAFVITKNRFELKLIYDPEKKKFNLNDLIQGSIPNKRPQDTGDFTNRKGRLNNLYSILIAPLKINTEKIVIVPHGQLHYLPFSALYICINNKCKENNYEGKYLIETKTLSILPSSSVIPFINNKRNPQPEAEKLLVLGVPSANDPNINLPELPNVEREVSEISKWFSQENRKISINATEKFLRKNASESNIIHIAAHGIYESKNALFSRLFLDKDDQNDGRLHVYEVYELDLEKANLIVLSACETNVGDLSKGDEVVGLNRAFIYAGTSNIIASLWTVPDQETANLMKDFYTNLRNDGMSKAEALRKAQINLRKIKEHPYFWSAFTLTGL
ncbi:MAG: CHAT domain-containing protein, partial [Sphaerospermopsis sp. SIO1G2]|nr:CHAT domain-containing protein [Sphaerospermopsis sp. SIO1G2]